MGPGFPCGSVPNVGGQEAWWPFWKGSSLSLLVLSCSDSGPALELSDAATNPAIFQDVACVFMRPVCSKDNIPWQTQTLLGVAGDEEHQHVFIQESFHPSFVALLLGCLFTKDM